MKAIQLLPLAAALVALPSSFAQKWEVGAGASTGFHNTTSVSGLAGSANTGFDQGLAASGWLGHNMYRYLGGEIRFMFQQNNLNLSSGGTKVSFGARSQAMHYDFLIYGAPTEAKVRPYVAVGGGVRNFQGTGRETAFQPLSDFALLTHTREWKPLVTAGGGVKFALSPTVSLRVEVRDYMTPFPSQIIAPAPGARISGFLHNIVPTFGLSYTF